MVNRNVVVIDDERSVRDVVRGYLENDGFVVFTAENGREGLALTARVKPALIVLDLMLPDVSGEEICRDIRTRSDVPILTSAGSDSPAAFASVAISIACP